MATTYNQETNVRKEQNGTSLEVKNFYIFGQGISHSMSPTIHIAGFRHYKLPHIYEIHQTATVDELSLIIMSPQFGGASVTMPHKIAIQKFCSQITEHARIIGAVNTLIPEGNVIRGDNTDWAGLAEVLREKSKNLSKVPDTGLVVGAGGASRAALYAMHQTGLKKIYLFNRTKSRADEIAQIFAPLFEITVLNSLEDVAGRGIATPDVIIGTIPADQTTADFFPSALFSKARGICVDMSYKPRHTPLLEVATRRRWITVTGIEVLLEQAFDQFRIWTGKPAPKEVMRQAVALRDKQMEEGRVDPAATAEETKLTIMRGRD